MPKDRASSALHNPTYEFIQKKLKTLLKGPNLKNCHRKSAKMA